MRRTKEERAFEAEGRDVFVEKFALLIVVVSLAQRCGFEHRRAGGIAQCEEARHNKADEHGDDKIEHDSGDSRDEKSGPITLDGPHHRADVPRVGHLYRSGDEHAGERGERDLAHPPGRDEHGDEQE